MATKVRGARRRPSLPLGPAAARTGRRAGAPGPPSRPRRARPAAHPTPGGLGSRGATALGDPARGAGPRARGRRLRSWRRRVGCGRAGGRGSSHSPPLARRSHRDRRCPASAPSRFCAPLPCVVAAERRVPSLPQGGTPAPRAGLGGSEPRCPGVLSAGRERVFPGRENASNAPLFQLPSLFLSPIPPLLFCYLFSLNGISSMNKTESGK